MANEANPCPCKTGDVFDYQGLGQEVSIAHIKAYISKPSLGSDKAVVVIHDIFGWQLPNTRFIADMLASNGYIAILPDFFKGQEPWKPSDDFSTIGEWLKTRDAKDINRETDVVLEYLKQECHTKKVGVIGFCWGGAAVHHLMLKYEEFQAAVSLYGIIKMSEDCFNLVKPTFFIFGEKDDHIPLDQVAEMERKLKEQCKVDFNVKIYPGQSHGFVHRKRENVSSHDKPYIEEARKDMLMWLNRYL